MSRSVTDWLKQITAGPTLTRAAAALVLVQLFLLTLYFVLFPRVPSTLRPISLPVVLALGLVAILVLLMRQDGRPYRRAITYFGILPIEVISFCVGSFWLLVSLVVLIARPLALPGDFLSPAGASVFMTLSSALIIGLCGFRAFTQPATESGAGHRIKEWLPPRTPAGESVAVLLCLAVVLLCLGAVEVAYIAFIVVYVNMPA
jgi:hypothetical protein